MNLVEAVKSGKPFRRKAWGGNHQWATDIDRERMNSSGGIAIKPADNHRIWLTPADTLADDWEIKPEPREWWVVLSPKGNVVETYTIPVEVATLPNSYTVVHVREVVE